MRFLSISAKHTLNTSAK